MGVRGMVSAGGMDSGIVVVWVKVEGGKGPRRLGERSGTAGGDCIRFPEWQRTLKMTNGGLLMCHPSGGAMGNGIPTAGLPLLYPCCKYSYLPFQHIPILSGVISLIIMDQIHVFNNDVDQFQW